MCLDEEQSFILIPITCSVFPYSPNHASCLLIGVTVIDLCEALSGIPALNSGNGFPFFTLLPAS